MTRDAARSSRDPDRRRARSVTGPGSILSPVWREQGEALDELGHGPGPDDGPGDPVGVLMLTKGLGRGGTERLLTGALRHIDRTRFRVEVAYLLAWKDAFVEQVRAEGIPVHCLDAPRPTSVGWARRLRRLVRERDIAIVHTHAPLPAVVARLALGLNGPAIVHTEHNLWDRYRLPTRWANALTYRRNAAVMAVSGGVAASIRSSGPGSVVPVEVVVHGIDIATLHHGHEARSRARALLDLPDDAPVIGTVGNFTAKKDHACLLDAFAMMRSERADARLVLVGTGPLEDRLREQATRLKLEDAVLFAGSRDDVFELLPGFDVFVLSSRFEGLPIALLEAMASGVTPVATGVGGIPEVITDGVDGWLVEPGDPGALATSLTKLLADDQTRSALADAARKRATDFDLAGAVSTIEDVYERALVAGRDR
jgi:glycosyltransferase involved in cell wall biosynthesis